MSNTNQQDVFAQVAAGVIEDSIKGAWKKVKDFFADETAKEAIEYGAAYEEYLRNTRAKHSKIKTLIYRRVPKDLYSFYECIGVKLGEKNISSESVNNLLAVSNKMIITGTGGLGKSTLFKHLYLNTIDDTNFVPVLVELRSVNTIDVKDISIKQMIFDVLTHNGFSLEEKYFEYSLQKGGYVIFLDGFDEVNRERTTSVANSIRAFSDQYPGNKYIISSRPSDGFIGWNDFTEMPLNNLTKEQALSLIKRIDFDQRIKENFYRELDERLYERYRSFASNPLLLTIMLLTYNDHAVFPEKLNDFYEQAFLTLFNMHDATKEEYVRDIRSALGCEDFKTIFSYLCFKSFFAGQFQFTEAELRNLLQIAKEKFPNIKFTVDDYQEDLLLSVCMLVKDGINYTFTHRSFQEYFAAQYTCKIADEAQKRLLAAWLKDTNRGNTEAFMEMLYNMQSEKVNHLVLAPGLVRLQKTYEENGFSIAFLKKLFSGFGVQKYSKTHPSKYRTTLTIRDNYLCSIMLLTSRFNGYIPSGQPSDATDIVRILKKNKIKTPAPYYEFDDVLELVDEHKLVTTFNWAEEQIKFAINMLPKMEAESLGNKRNVMSILDAL